MRTTSVIETNYSEHSSIIESVHDQNRWISQINKILDEQVLLKLERVSIFRVPASLSIYKPEAYVPQLVALGPYHHFRTELYEMERFKLTAATRYIQKNFIKSIEFKELVNVLKKHEHRVRACYHKYIDYEGETLAWIIAIDGLFFLDFLDEYNKNPSTTMTQVVDSKGGKLAYGSILGDLMMLENQIPIFILGEIFSSHSELATNDLNKKLLVFVKSFSPLTIKTDLTLFESPNPPNHLLDLLYKSLVPMPSLAKPNHETGHTEDLEAGAPKVLDETTSFNMKTVSEVLPKLLDMVSKVKVKPIQMVTAPVNALVSFASGVSGISSNLPKKDKVTGKPENEGPEVEEINVPSVTQLNKNGVKFIPSNGGIKTVAFDPQTKVFTLPVIKLDVHSEVVMRNLVAYEASIAPESLVFTRYMDLMHGIIDTAEDAGILKKKKIIESYLKTDAEVAEIFNRMSKSVKMTSVLEIDNTIRDVNRYYNGVKTVWICRRMRKFVYQSWKIFTLIAVVLLMLMMALQSFCSVYACTKVFGTITSTN